MADQKRRYVPIERGLASEPVGNLGEHVGETFILQGTDQSGNLVEWVVKPTGSNSFNITVPESHELGNPDAWENISIMTQRVVTAGDAMSCGCDGSQCGCQGSNCGSNCSANAASIRLAPDRIRTAAILGRAVQPREGIRDQQRKELE